MSNISPIYARIVLRELQRTELDEARLFQNTGLNRQRLQTGGDISLEAFTNFLRNASTMAGVQRSACLLAVTPISPRWVW